CCTEKRGDSRPIWIVRRKNRRFMLGRVQVILRRLYRKIEVSWVSADFQPAECRKERRRVVHVYLRHRTRSVRWRFFQILADHSELGWIDFRSPIKGRTTVLGAPDVYDSASTRAVQNFVWCSAILGKGIIEPIVALRGVRNVIWIDR